VSIFDVVKRGRNHTFILGWLLQKHPHTFLTMSIVITKQMTAEEVRKILATLPASKAFKAAAHCGVLTLREDPLQFQKRLRDEWQ
jgi:hypothetical protein